MTYITYPAISRWWISMSHVLRWSTLRQFGNLPLMRAVMFAPVIAYLILFNDYVFEFLEQVSKNIGMNRPEGIGITNVYFLYYGLIFVGVASILYSLSCPASVAGFADSMAFARGVQETKANTVVMSFFDYVLAKFVQNAARNYEGESADYPEDTRLLTSRMVIEIYKTYLENERLTEGPEGKSSGEEDAWWQLHGEFYTGSGYFDSEKIAESVYQGPRIIWAFTEPYRAIAAKSFVADIAVAKYEIDDHSRLVLRILTAFFYNVGFILLLIPSVRTFISISAAMVRGV
ncbi:hypothetical protein [Sinorhizobium fredii]